MNDQSDLRKVEAEELFGELRRRQLPEWQLRTALGLREQRFDEQARLRSKALVILGGLTLVVVVIIGFLAVTSKEIPDLLSGLAGSGIGAIAGILASGSSGGPRSTSEPG